LIVVMLTSSWL